MLLHCRTNLQLYVRFLLLVLPATGINVILKKLLLEALKSEDRKLRSSVSSTSPVDARYTGHMCEEFSAEAQAGLHIDREHEFFS
jgi:hypothetical protein